MSSARSAHSAPFRPLRALLLVGQFAREELRHLRREKSIVVVLLGLPLLYPLLISWLYMADAAVERPLALVDLDGSAASRRLSLLLDATQGARVVERSDSLQLAAEALTERRTDAVLLVPAGFAATLAKGQRASVKLWTNAANLLTYGTVYPAVMDAVDALGQEMGARWWRARGTPSDLVEAHVAPLQPQVRYLFHPTAAYGSFFVPGLMVIVMQQLMLIGLAFSLAASKEKGQRSAAARRHPLAFHAGVVATHTMFHGLAIVLILGGVFPLFGWPAGDPLALGALLGLFVLAMAPLAVLVGSVVPDRFTALSVLMFLSVPILMISGFAMPPDQMPSWLARGALLVPATPTLQATRLLTTGGAAELAAVAPQLRLLALQGCGYLLLALAVGLLWGRRRRTAAQRSSSR